MNYDHQRTNGTVDKLKKCVIAGAATLMLNGCASTGKMNDAIKYREVPHMSETSLNTKLVNKQKPIDNEVLRQEDEMLNEVCFSELYDVQINDRNRATSEAEILQKLADVCQRMKLLSQRGSSQWKKMEQAICKKYQIPSYEILDIENNMWAYRNTELIKTTVNGVRIKNQGLPEDTDLNAVRAACQHRMHKFMDAKILAFSDALPREVVSQEKYELGYGVFEERHFMKMGKEDFDTCIDNINEYVVDDIINYAVYEYRHGLQIENPAALEVELETLFDQMERALNAYGYQGKGSEKDMPLYYQAKNRLVQILSKAPAMFGDAKNVEMLIGEVALSMALQPLNRELCYQGFDFSKFSANTAAQQTVGVESIK